MIDRETQRERDDLDQTIAYINREGGGNMRDKSLGKNPFEELHKRWRSGGELTNEEREEMTDEAIDHWNESKKDYLSRDY